MNEAMTEFTKIIERINKTPKAKKVFESEDWKITIQFELEGEDQPFYLVVKDGIGQVIAGKKKDADMVIGSRYTTKTGYKSSIVRRLGSAFFAFLSLFHPFTILRFQF